MTAATTAPPTLDPMDPAGLAELLTPDEKAVQASVRQLCETRIDPYIADWFETGDIPDIRGMVRELGALGMHLPYAVADTPAQP